MNSNKELDCETLDFSPLEGRLRLLHVAERVFRGFNSGIWLMYWLFVPLIPAGILIGLLVFAERIYSLMNPTMQLLSPHDRELLRDLPRYALAELSYYASNKAIFGYHRLWAMLAILLVGGTLLLSVSDWATHGFGLYQFDHEIFYYALGSSLLSNSWLLLVLVALTSLLRLSPRQRELLRPVDSPAVFPRRSMRALTLLPDTIDFVRKGRERLWISMLYILGAGCFAVVPYSLTVSSQNYERATRDVRRACESDERKRECFVQQMHIAFVANAVVLSMGIVIGLLLARWILRRAQRRLAISLEEVIQVDKRPPIVFLRSFAHDKLVLPAVNRSVVRRILQGEIPDIPLEHILLARLTAIGPVIALGNPADTSRPYGAARTYLDRDSWRIDVLKYLRNAVHIVICLDNSEGLLWELEQIALGALDAKCIFIVHPRFRADLLNSPLVRRFGGVEDLLAPLSSAAESKASSAVLGWFQIPGQGLQLCRASSFSVSSIELFFRAFANNWLSRRRGSSESMVRNG